jgi:hypothetical protein
MGGLSIFSLLELTIQLHSHLVGGIPTPLKNDDIPNIWKVKKFMFQTTNQTFNVIG